MSKAAAILSEAGLKATPTRLGVLEILLREHGPHSIEDLRKRLKKGSCDKVTVYRTLEALEKAQLLTQCALGDGRARYEYRSPDHSHHHHILCTACRSVEPVDGLCLPPQWEASLAQRGYRNLTHRLEFLGLCQNCAA